MDNCDDWRKKIDELDATRELLNQRARLRGRNRQLKQKDGNPFTAGARASDPRAGAAAQPRPLGNDALKRLFERILDEARVVEKQSFDKKNS
jgi:chorismate mutase